MGCAIAHLPDDDRCFAEAVAELKSGNADPISQTSELARATLDKYWTRNLLQNFLVFSFSIAAVAAGFGATLWAVLAGPRDVAWIGAIAGAFTQLIGATLLFMYRSTMQQGSVYTATLERINGAGMAWSVVKSMPESSPDEIAAKNGARNILVTQLMSNSMGYASTSSLEGDATK
jgi:TRADD-N domain-containing protein